MEEKQETTESGSGSRSEPRGRSDAIPTFSEQIARVTANLLDTYLGHSYKAKDGSSELPEFWRWLNATFGSFSLAFAIVVLQLLTPDKPTGDAFLSRLSTLFLSPLFSELPVIGILLPVFVLLGFCMLGAVVATSIKCGGPIRLFIMGMILLSLPLLLAARVV